MVFRTRADEMSSETGASEAVKDAVGHMVRQFADPLAFYRELVQNSIDAGAHRIDVRLHYNKDEQCVSVVVHDDGCGMTLETVERCLLVLFRSSKDKDPTKIGKFGVGFFSIFSLNPTTVRVDTGTGAPTGLRLEIGRDFSYEVSERSELKGTSVSLTLPMKLSEARAFAERSLQALDRWCPHVEVELHLLSSIAGGEIDRRIDRPFALDGDCVLPVVLQDFKASIKLGHEGTSCFYKRGILLYESPQPIAPGVCFKIQSTALVHTVSRDNVKRDSGFERCVETLHKVVQEQLLPMAQQEVAKAMRAVVEASLSADSTLPSLQARAWRLLQDVYRIKPDWKSPAIPLCHPTRAAPDQVLLTHRRDVKWRAAGPSAMTAALAEDNQPTLWSGALGHQWSDELARLLAPESVAVEQRFSSVTPVDTTTFDAEQTALFEIVRRMLNAVSIPSCRPALIGGYSKSQLFVAVQSGRLDAARLDAALLVDAADAQSPLYALLSNRGCALNVEHAYVRKAMAAAKNNYALSALLLARTVLLQAAKLDRARDEALLQTYLSSQR
jgi:molecular chaperone HtpG